MRITDLLDKRSISFWQLPPAPPVSRIPTWQRRESKRQQKPMIAL